ncbi:MAG: hypothetical protein JRE23_03245 [Deltaproteobacteria bacterium]|nr:hypothetical protein [Deltaproteobacteria bacterium]
MATGNGYFVHDQAVMELAHHLVKEYDKHEREQDKLWKQAHGPQPTSDKSWSKQGGMIKK